MEHADKRGAECVLWQGDRSDSIEALRPRETPRSPQVLRIQSDGLTWNQRSA
jgi:hypothetical protein